jgi:hypothetical protein
VRSKSPALRAIAKRLESSLDAFGDLRGVGSGELLHDHDQSGPAVDNGIPDQRLVIDFDLCDVTEGEIVGPLDRNLGDLGRIGQLLQQVPYLEALLRCLDESAGARGRGFQEAEL